MKHVQKLPKNAGDSVLLGTVLAIGIQPELNQVFVSFDCNGELVTYTIDNSYIVDYLYQKLHDRILNNDIGNGGYKFDDLTQREDLRCEIQDNVMRIIPITSPDDYMEWGMDNTKPNTSPW